MGGSNGKENGNYRDYGVYTGDIIHRGYMGIMEKKMDTIRINRVYTGGILGLYGGHMGIMEKRMETIGINRVYIGVQ